MESTKDNKWDCGNGKILIMKMTLILKREKRVLIKKIYKLELNARGGGGCARSGHGVIILAL